MLLDLFQISRRGKDNNYKTDDWNNSFLRDSKATAHRVLLQWEDKYANVKETSQCYWLWCYMCGMEYGLCWCNEMGTPSAVFALSEGNHVIPNNWWIWFFFHVYSMLHMRQINLANYMFFVFIFVWSVIRTWCFVCLLPDEFKTAMYYLTRIISKHAIIIMNYIPCWLWWLCMWVVMS